MTAVMPPVTIMTASAKKGAAPRVLDEKIREALRGLKLPRQAHALLVANQKAANKVIASAERGADVTVVLTVLQGPLGGWSVSMIVDIEPPRQER